MCSPKCIATTGSRQREILPERVSCLGLSLVPTAGVWARPQAESALTGSWLPAPGPASAPSPAVQMPPAVGQCPRAGPARPPRGCWPWAHCLWSWLPLLLALPVPQRALRGHLQLGPAHIPSRRVVWPQTSVQRREGPGTAPEDRGSLGAVGRGPSLRDKRQGRLVLSPTVCLQIGSTSRGRGLGPPPSCLCSTSSTARRPAPARGATTWRCGHTPSSTAFRMRPATTTRPRTRVGPPPASLFPGQSRLLSLVGVPEEAQTCGFRGAGSWSPQSLLRAPERPWAGSCSGAGRGGSDTVAVWPL